MGEINHRVELHAMHDVSNEVRGILDDEVDEDQYDEVSWSEDDRGTDVGIRFCIEYGDGDGAEEKARSMKDTLYQYGTVWLWY